MINLQILPETQVLLQVLEPIVKSDVPVIQPKRITENGVYSAKEEGISGFDPVTVAVDMTPAFEAGRQAEYDRFWDAFQQNGNRTDYRYAFGIPINDGVPYWTGSIFKPKYDLKPTRVDYMFAGCPVQDLEAMLMRSGVSLDTSNCTEAFRMFTRYCSANGAFDPNTAAIIPALDLSKATNIGELFSYANVKVIRKIILNDQGTQDTSTLFHGGCAELEEIRVGGVIGKNFRPQWSSKLSNESVQSIIDHLKDLTGATAQTLTFHADVGAKLTEEQKATVTQKNWVLVY